MPGLSCRMWDLVPWLGIEPGSPALEARSLNHWITREIPTNIFKNNYYASDSTLREYNGQQRNSLPWWGFCSSGRRQTINQINKKLCQTVLYMEKSKTKQTRSEGVESDRWGGQGRILEEIAPEQTPGWSEGQSHDDIWRKSIQGRGRSTCTGPEAGTGLAHARSTEKKCSWE